MDQFLDEIRAYAMAIGVEPTTVVQRAAGLSGAAWPRWESGEGSPTLRTVDRIRAFIAANPPAAREDEVA